MGGVLIVLSTLCPRCCGRICGTRLCAGHVCVAGVCGHRICRRLRQSFQAAEFGADQPKKFSLQLLVSAVVAIGLLALATRAKYSTELVLPFFKRVHPNLVVHSLLSTPHFWPLAFVPFLLFLAIVITGASNAVNLTDGLDGLAIGCTVIAAGALTVLDLRQQQLSLGDVSRYRLHPARCRAHRFLRRTGGRVSRLSLVQRAPRGNFYG